MAKDNHEHDKGKGSEAQRPVPSPGTKISITEDAEAAGDTLAAYDYWRAGSGRRQVPGIIKCFGARPDFLRQVVDFSNTVHFSEGHLFSPPQGDDCQLCLLSQSMSILTGQPRLLPACSGSHRSMRSRHPRRQIGRTYSAGAPLTRLRQAHHGWRLSLNRR